MKKYISPKIEYMMLLSQEVMFITTSENANDLSDIELPGASVSMLF